MALTKIRLGTREDGTPLYHYQSDGAVVIPGPITGEIETSDGTTYDVSPEIFEVDLAHVEEVAELIGERYAAEGHPQVEGDFQHVPGGSDGVQQVWNSSEGAPSPEGFQPPASDSSASSAPTRVATPAAPQE